MLRRTVWAIFRIEWEVIVKVHTEQPYDTLPLRAGSDSGSEDVGATHPSEDD